KNRINERIGISRKCIITEMSLSSKVFGTIVFGAAVLMISGSLWAIAQAPAPQMLAHCSLSMQWAVGEVAPEKGPLPARLMGRLIKPLVVRNESPLRRNSPTAKSLIIADERDLSQEREHLSRLIDQFSAGGAAACTKNPHTFFGNM